MGCGCGKKRTQRIVAAKAKKSVSVRSARAGGARSARLTRSGKCPKCGGHLRLIRSARIPSMPVVGKVCTACRHRMS